MKQPHPVTKKHQINRKHLPFNSFKEALTDLEQIVNGHHEFKLYFYTLPVSVNEIDSFPGYAEFVKSSRKTIDSMESDLEKHFRAILYAVECLEQDCTYIRNMIDIRQKQLYVDSNKVEYGSMFKRIQVSREQTFDMAEEVKKYKKH